MNDRVGPEEQRVVDYLYAEAEHGTPDVPTLVRAGVRRGRADQRRRRLWGLSVAVMAVVAVAGGLGYTFTTGGLLRSDRGPADSVVQRVPATPRGLTAAVMAHVDGTTWVVGGSTLTKKNNGAQMQGALMSVMGYRIGDAKVELQVIAVPRALPWHDVARCKDLPASSTCRATRLADGSRMVTMNMEHRHIVLVRRQSQTLMVMESVPQARAAATTLPIPVQTLKQIATDPLVGVETSPAMLDRGAAIEGFRNGWDGVATSGSSGPVSSVGGGSASAPPVPSQQARTAPAPTHR